MKLNENFDVRASHKPRILVSDFVRKPRYEMKDNKLEKEFILGSKEAAEALFMPGWVVKELSDKRLVMTKELK